MGRRNCGKRADTIVTSRHNFWVPAKHRPYRATAGHKTSRIVEFLSLDRQSSLEAPLVSILVTGGAGYIGSHAAKALAAAGFRPVVLDDLSRGHRHAVKWGPFISADVGDSSLVCRKAQSNRTQCRMIS